MEGPIGAAWILCAGALPLLTAWFWGRILIERLPVVRDELTRLEDVVFSLGLGFALLSQAVFLLGLARLYYDGTFYALIPLSLAAWWKWGRRRAPYVEPPAARLPRVALWVGGVAAAAYLPLYLSNALAPDVGPDAVSYHLMLVSKWYQARGIVELPQTIYAYLSHGVEMVFVFGHALARFEGPKVIHFGLFLATLVALYALGRRFGSPLAGWLAAGIYGLTSVAATTATTAYNDCALAFFELLALYAILLWRAENRSRTRSRDREGATSARAAGTSVQATGSRFAHSPDRSLTVAAPSTHASLAWPALIGVLAGFCYGVKYTGAFAVLGAAGVVLWRRRPQAVLAFGLAAACFIAPWAIRNLAWTGNPLAPFYNRLFPNEAVHVNWEVEYRDYLRHYAYPQERNGFQDRLEIPVELAFRGRKLGGFIGPVLLCLPLGLLAFRRPVGRWLLGAAAVAILAYPSNVGARFMIAPLAFLSAATGFGVAGLGRRAGPALAAGLVVFHGVSSWPAAIEVWHAEKTFFHLDHMPWRVLTGEETRQQYQLRRIGGYGLVQVLNMNSTHGDRVLSFSALPYAHYRGHALVAYESAEGEELAREMLAVVDTDFQPTRRMRYHWDEPLDLAGLRIEQTAVVPGGVWEIAEIRLLRGEPIEADLEAEAELAPWDAGRLVDGDRLTIWRTWRSLEPTWVEVRALEPVAASGVELIQSWGQHYPRHRFTAIRPDGERKLLSVRTDARALPIDDQRLREHAHRKLREAGIALVVDHADSGYRRISADIAKDPAAWGFEEVWHYESYRIYRVLPEVGVTRNAATPPAPPAPPTSTDTASSDN